MSHESCSQIDCWILGSIEQYLECGVLGEGVHHGELVWSDVRQTTVVPDEDCQVAVSKVLNVLLVGPNDFLVPVMSAQSHQSVPATWIVVLQQETA